MPEISSFRKVLAYTPQPSILLQIVNDEAIIVVANSAYLQLLAAKEESIIHKPLFNTPNFGVDDINTNIVLQLKQLLQQCVAAKTTINLQEQAFSIYYLLQNKIERYTLSFSITPIVKAGGNNVEFVLLNITNDTEKVTLQNTIKLLNKQLSESEADIKEIENRLLIGRWEIDIENKKMIWSDEVFIICGYAPQAFDPSEKRHFSITHPDDLEYAKQALQETIQFGKPFSIERRLIKANGDIVHVLSKGKAIKNETGRVVKVKGFFQDITEQVQQKKAINTVKANQEALINGTNDLVWLMDETMQVLIANNAYINKTKELAEGYALNNSEATLATRNERTNRWMAMVAEVVKGNTIAFKEQIFNPLSNAYEYALVSINPVYNSKNVVKNIACFAKDVTLETNNLITLEATKAKLENTLAASIDIICMINGNAIFLDVSAASEKILGYKPEEMIGKNLTLFLHPEDVEFTLAEAPKVKVKGVVTHFENRYITKDGATINISWTGTYQAATDILYCVGRDITEKKRQEQALQASKKEYQSLFDNNPSALIIWDFETQNIVECNTKALTIYGYTKEEFLQLSIKDIRPIEEYEKFNAATTSEIAYNNASNNGWKHKKKNGETFFIEVSKHLIDYKERRCALIMINDVTDKLHIQKALLESEKDYKNLFEHNPSPMFIWDFETLEIIESNNEIRELFGYTSNEFVTLSILDLIPEDDVAFAKSAFDVQSKHGHYAIQGVKHKKKNGELLLVDINAHNLNYKGKKASLVLINDVTEKLKIQRDIAESEAKYRSFFENSIDGIFITKKGGGIIDVNPSGCKLLQMTKEEVCMAGRSGITDTTDPRLETFLSERQKLGYAKAVVTHIRKDGSRFEAEVSSSSFTDANGESVNALILRDITERLENQEQVRESNERFNYVSKATSEAIWDWNLITGEIFWGDGFKIILGYDNKTTVPTYEMNLNLIHPRDRDMVNKKVFDAIESNQNAWEETYRFLKADKTYIKIINRAYIIRDKAGKAIRMVGAKRDVSQYQYYNELERLERNILAINEAGDKELEEVLSIYLLGIEVLHPGMICSILQVKGNQLFNLATPSLPEAYINAINGVIIGNNVGSCGTAAFTKKNIIATDIENDLRWVDYKGLAEEFGLKACWSHPIFNQKEEVIATFAAYYQQTKSPSAIEENTITRASNILKIILESYERTQALKESNERYNLATKATSDAIWDWDLTTGFLVWTEGWQTIFGYNLATLPNDISFKIQNTHPEDVEKLTASYYKIVKSNQTNWTEQYRLKKANGEYAYVVSKGFVIRNEDGRAIRMVGATRDITKRIQEELRLKLLESVITNTNDAVLIAEAEPLELPGPRIVYVNEAFTKMTGYEAEEVIGKTPRILQGPKSNRRELDRLKECLKKWESCEVSLLNYRKDGSEFWVNINVSPVADETGWYTHWVAIQRDVTEKVQEEQRLTKAIIKAQENERYEIGGELHDNVCQILTSSQLSLKMLKKVLGPNELIWYEKGTEAITLASREIRNLSHRLAPSFFNDTTLELAINTLVQTFNIDEGYQIHIVFDGKFKAQPTKQEFQINLYRIVQEQLKNIFKYAEASVIEIVGTVKNGKLKMEIIDNGVGFDTNKTSSGIGMANMKRRTELFLGKFEVTSAIGKGCKIAIEVPLEEIN